MNEHPVDLPLTGTAVEAVRRFDADLADRVVAGEATLTDGRGIALAADAPQGAGAIIRVVARARREPGADDADA